MIPVASARLSGTPSRIGYLEEVYSHISRFSGVVHWNGVQLLDWYREQRKA